MKETALREELRIGTGSTGNIDRSSGVADLRYEQGVYASGMVITEITAVWWGFIWERYDWQMALTAALGIGALAGE
jgi:hypothetical protein